MGGGAGIGGFGQQPSGPSGGFGGQQNPSSGVGGFGRPQGGFNNRQGGFGQQAGFNGFNQQPQFQNPYGPPQMQQMYSPYSQADQNQFGFQQPQAFRDYQQQQQARMFQNPYQQNPYQQNPYQQNPYQQQFGRQGGFGFGQQPQYQQQAQLQQRMQENNQRVMQQTQQQPPQYMVALARDPNDPVVPLTEDQTREASARLERAQFENMSQADRMRAASDDSGMGRGGYPQQSMLDQFTLYTPDYYQQRAMPTDMPQRYGRDPFQSMGGLGSLGNSFKRYGMQRGQQTAPPGMERRVGMLGEYFVPAGTPYNPAAD